MRALPLLLLALSACAASPADRMFQEGAPMETVPHAWILWGGGTNRFIGILICRDGQVEGNIPVASLANLQRIPVERRSGRIDAAAVARLEQALNVPPAVPVPTKPGKGGFGPETEPPDRPLPWTVTVLGTDGAKRTIEYHTLGTGTDEHGGEPLHPLLRKILHDLSE